MTGDKLVLGAVAALAALGLAKRRGGRNLPQDNPRQGKKQGSRSEADDFLGFLKARRDGKGQGSELSSFSAYKASRSGSGRSEADDFLSFLKAKRAEKPSPPARAKGGQRKRLNADLFEKVGPISPQEREKYRDAFDALTETQLQSILDDCG